MSKANLSRTRKVIISFRTLNPLSIEIFSGAIHALRTLVKWDARLYSDPLRLKSSDIETAKEKGIKGILVSHALQEDLCEALLQSDIPLVLISNTEQRLFKRRENMAVAEIDNRKIGELGADYFRSLGKFRTYAFLPDIPSSRWSRMRLRGFQTKLRASGIQCSVFAGGSLSKWISSLKRPVALFLAGDYLAAEAMKVCGDAHLDIPNDISILGVDNNPILCESAPISLSSIEPSARLLGILAVRQLEKMMRARGSSTRPIIIRTPPLRVVERASTTQTKPSAYLVERAMRFIRENFDKGITARDVASYLNVSPQLLALRFSQLEHRNVRDTIIKLRLTRVKNLLLTTNLSVADIAIRCGFKKPNFLSHQFAKRIGMSPGSWRSNNRKSDKAQSSSTTKSCST